MIRYAKLGRDIRLSVENLLLHKLRSFLTMLGVVFGVGSVMAMLSVGEGASQEALAQIRKVGSNNIIITSMKSIEEESSSSTRVFLSMYGLTYKDYQRMAQTFQTIKKIAPAKMINKEGRLDERSLELRVVGTTPNWFELVRRPLIAGREISQSDIYGHAAVVVLTEFGARKLLATRNTIGQNLKIGSNNFEIIGIVKSEGANSTDIQLPDQEIDAYIPMNVARTYYGDTSRKLTSGSFEMKRVELDQIIVEVNKMEDVESTAIGIKVMLKRFHNKKDYSISVPLALLRQAEATKRTFNIVLGAIACISLLVGGIGIMNIMLASVTERTREIGIRRAIGAKKKQIITQFLIETVVLSIIGGIVGLGVGLFIPMIITQFSGMPTYITLWSVLLPLFISALIGLIFGIYPAARAANVDPIVALRHE